MKKTFSALVVLAFLGCSSSDPATGVTPDSGTTPPLADSGTGNPDTGAPPQDAGTDAGETCSAARAQLLKPIGTVSTGEVIVLADAAGVKTVFVDATAGGAPASATNPRVYLNLETVTKVSVTDVTAGASTAWDLSLKRPILFTNGGDGGGGQGASIFLKGVDFDTVTAASATGKTYVTEKFFDADCNPQVDATGAVKTSFDGWYDYEQVSNTLTPAAGTWIVKGGTGKLFKVQVLSYYATPDGGTGMAGGRYTLRIAAL